MNFGIITPVILILHGLIHLLGPAVYLGLAEVAGLGYKTTLLGGRWDVGESGIRIFGLMWIVPAVGFVAAAIALILGWGWGLTALAGVTLFSLLLTGLDWSVAFAGALVNLAILAVIWIGPYFAG